MSELAFRIQGGCALHGSVRIGGAKNASYKLMIAALLGSSESRLLNFSHISDVAVVGEISRKLGAKVWQAGERAIFIDPSSLIGTEVPNKDASQGRFSTLFIPVLLTKFGTAKVPAPGGDKIGKRPLDRHWDGLRALGAEVWVEQGYFCAKTAGLHGTTYTFEKNTHTGTETMIMAAVCAKGKTILQNAALEPEVDDLIHFLNRMGARIARQPNRVITIEGVPELHGAIHQIIPDRNEAVSYACAAIATGGDVIIENANKTHLSAFLAALDQIGGKYECDSYGIRFYRDTQLIGTDITTEPEPGFMTDWQPLWAILMSQATGTSSIHETIYESRFQYVAELNRMGVQTELFQPSVSDPEKTYNFNYAETPEAGLHALKIYGPARLKPGTFVIRDLRHGATLIIASLLADGVSYLTGIDHVDRGYETLDERLRSMGANITRVQYSLSTVTS
jgi:UDP-N-acetylglucosamine 1-carboxyvinyltransferase